MTAKRAESSGERTTHVVSEEVFRQVYDSPRSLPGKERWLTNEADVRAIEKRLGLEAGAIGAPLWVSGDTRSCRTCGRETSWLDIVESGLEKVHDPSLLVKVILGERKYVNTEAPRAIADLVCSQCNTPITDLRSFKCHNWAYAVGRLREVVEQAAAVRHRRAATSEGGVTGYSRPASARRGPALAPSASRSAGVVGGAERVSALPLSVAVHGHR